MNRHIAQNRSSRTGFTMLELVIVIGVIALLASISFAVIGNMLDTSRKAATLTTLAKIDKLLQQQIGALYREYDVNNPSSALKVASGKYRKGNPATGDGDNYFLTADERSSYSLGIKDRFLTTFPQNALEASTIPLAKDAAVFAEWVDKHVTSPPAPNPDRPETHSSELLYIALTAGAVRGATPVDSSAFGSSEITDTDGDGFIEFVDAWGNPLRFYRYPTRLINPFGFVSSRVDAAVSAAATSIPITAGQGGRFGNPLSVLQGQDPSATLFAVIGREVVEITGVSGDTLTVVRGAQSTDPQSYSAGTLIKLAPMTEIATLLLGFINTSVMAHDPDDPRGLLTVPGNLVNSTRIAGASPDQDFEIVFHTLDSYHAPLIVSAGSDEDLGLREPFDIGSPGSRDWGNLAQPDEAADPDILVNPGSGPLADNLTNHMEGMGN